jgi:hypothetical protein
MRDSTEHNARTAAVAAAQPAARESGDGAGTTVSEVDQQRAVDPRLIEFLREQDAPCRVCGYNLRGLTKDMCPECGIRFQLGVYPAENYSGTLIAALVPIAMTTGVGLLIFILCLRWGFPASGREFALLGFVVAGFVCGIGMAVSYAMRAAFFKRSKINQRAFVMLTWFLTVAIWAFLLSSMS